MSIKSYIIDPTTGLKAQVVDGAETNALAVATRPLKTYSNSQQFFTNVTYGADMNKNALAGGTPDKVHDGIDSVLWTASAITGTWTFDSTDENHTAAGAKSIDATDTIDNDVSQYAKGSALTIADYTSVTGWIYITKWATLGTKGVHIYGWDTSTGLPVSSEVDIGNYVDTTVLNTWHKFTIPKPDFNFTATTLNAIRIKTIDIGVGVPPAYYLDDIQFEETGTIIYEIKPNKDTWLHVENFMISIANNIASTLADGTLPGLAYDSFLGEALSNGIVYQRVQNNIIKASAIIQTIGDWLSLPETNIASNISDGTNTFVSLFGDFTDTIVLKYEDRDELRIVISDNLSGLLHLRIAAGCKKEDRKNN